MLGSERAQAGPEGREEHRCRGRIHGQRTSSPEPGGVKENSQGSQTPGTARDQPRPPEWGRIAQLSTDDTVIHDSCSGSTSSRIVELGSLNLKIRFIPTEVRFATEEGFAKKGVTCRMMRYATAFGVAGLCPE